STSTVVSSSANPSASGQSVTFTATVSATAPGEGTPSGTVQFVIDGSNSGSPVRVSSAGGVATASFSTASLTVGAHTTLALSPGDASFTATTSLPLPDTLAMASTSTVVSSSANPSASGQSVTLTATVSATAPAAGTPSGTVQFM